MKTALTIIGIIVLANCLYSVWQRVNLLEKGIVELAKQTLPNKNNSSPSNQS